MLANVIFKSVYSVSIKYSYHSSGAGKNKRHWKWAESLVQEVNVSMTNSSSQSWRVLVKALCRLTDGDYINSTIGGVLRAKEVTANIIDMEKYGDTTICGVEIYSDAAGSVDKPVYKFFFPEIQIKPDAEEQAKLSSKIAAATEEMKVNNKNAKPGCFVLTACYGSYDAPTVFAFRRFRDNYLAQSKLGRNFIAWYYTHGPQWAETISDKPRIKALFRSVFNQLAKILPR